MIGTSWMRQQGPKDALMVEALRRGAADGVMLWRRSHPVRDSCMKAWNDITPLRDGPVNPERVEVDDPAAMAQRIKEFALGLGGDRIGMTALKPEYIEYGVDIPHRNVICVICHEDYSKSIEGPQAVDHEAMTTYVECARIATELARYIREELGYPALAHHNGSVQVQAIPVMWQVGFGELGKHGSLINPDLGANFRPAIVTTDLPVAYDDPISFGVQDYCMTCNLCANNCPGDAIPEDSNDYIVTDGQKRWLTDIDKCYPISRFRPEYCHICVDVCPYIHKENDIPGRKETYKAYMKERKAEGYKTPKTDKNREAGA
jgi:epoxyqueuosine reductase